MSETSKFCPKIKKFLSENVREHKKPQVSTHTTNRVVVCFHKKNASKNQEARIFIRLKVLMKIYENKPKQWIRPSQRLKMHKHTKN